MARTARYRQAEGMLEPGRIYHVWNRGVDRCAIYHDPADRLYFLSLIALTCSAKGIVIHSFSLMGNHYHLVLEDTRGLISQAMQTIQGTYAQYFNGKYARTGHLFQGRFRSKIVKTAVYYDQLCAYVLANPVRAGLVEAPESYPWSSAALAFDSTLTSQAFAERMLERYGSKLPVSAAGHAGERRQQLVDAFRSGAWLDSSRVRAGRTPDDYRERLLSYSVPTAVDQLPADDEAVEQPGPARRATPQPPRVGTAFAGLKGDKVREKIEQNCLRMVPIVAGKVSRVDVLRYLSWRFLAGSVRAVGTALRTSADAVARSVQRVRLKRTEDPAWDPLLRRVEWRLRWVVEAGPWRY